MVPYKKIDLIVEAFSQMPDKKLIVIGDGPELKKIQSKAGTNVILMGYQNNDVLKDYMQRAKAFVFAAEEDFGIIPVEAQACGTPVIAFGKGGALETIENGRTGIFFDTQTSESIIEAVNKFESSNDFDPYYIRRNAERFSPERFRNEFQAIVDTEIKNYFGEASTNSILNQLNVESDIDTSRKESVIFNSEHEHVA